MGCLANLISVFKLLKKMSLMRSLFLVNRHFISSRTLEDLPAFCLSIIQELLSTHKQKTAFV
ncbi:hypothetical protein DB44_CR00110 [Candidatus Protochlamydia amoebophila]|nr:hypothetical protein DB44_CR00110 [Candidatus Protochlamydia amoebophila]